MKNLLFNIMFFKLYILVILFYIFNSLYDIFKKYKYIIYIMLRIGSTSTNSSTSKAINIRNDNERIGILKDPDGKYSLDISGSINCNALLVDGSIMNNFSPVWLTNDSDDNIYYSEGNVGIGTTSSIEK